MISCHAKILKLEVKIVVANKVCILVVLEQLNSAHKQVSA